MDQTVTVLFCDLVGSTEFLVSRDDDAADRTRRSVFRVLRQAATRNSGTVVKSLGEGLMVTFTSATNAVSCATAMQQGIAELNRRRDQGRQALRVGVSVGEVRIEDDDCFGLPVVEASRLCASAEGDQILVSDVLHSLVGFRGEFQFTTLGPLDLKGFAEPVITWEVDWQPDGARPALAVPLAPGEEQFFVGREVEFDRALAIWKEASVGSRQILLVSGEPGIGKTRLAAEVARAAHEQGAIVLYGRCDEDPLSPYQPFLEAARSYLTVTTAADMRDQLGRHASFLRRLVPELDSASPDGADSPAADPEAERHRLFEAVAALLQAITLAGPLLLVLDDLHWATKPALVLLRHLARANDLNGLLVLGTFRDTDIGRGHPLADLLADLRREHGVERLALGGLEPHAVASLLEQEAGLEGCDSEMAAALHAGTAGNPFFLGEMVRNLLESRVVSRRLGSGFSPGEFEQLGLTAGVREVVGQRLTRLSDVAQEMLTVASVVGSTFSLAVVQRAMNSGGDEERILDGIDQAISARVLIEGDRPGHFAFAHALVREAVYAELSMSRRARLHGRVGETLETLPGGDDRLPLLAYHFAEAGQLGDAVKAADYGLRAARRALDQLAFEEAADIAQRSLAAVEALELAGTSQADLLLVLARAHRLSGDLLESQEAARRAAAAARQLGSAERLALAAVDNAYFRTVGGADPAAAALCEEALAMLGDDHPDLRAQVLTELALHRGISESGGVAAEEMATEAVAIARTAGDAHTLGRALFARVGTVMGTGRMPEQLAMAEELLQIGRETGEARTLGYGQFIRGVTDLEIGDRRRFEADRRDLDATATELRWWFMSALTATVWEVTRALLDGRFDEVEALANQVLEKSGGQPNFVQAYTAQLFQLMREVGRSDELLQAVAPIVRQRPELIGMRAALVAVEADLGHLEGARTLLDEVGVDSFAAIPHNMLRPFTLCLLAEVAAALGDPAPAESLDDLLLPHSGHIAVATWGVICIGAVDRYRGHLAAVLQRWDEASERYQSAARLEETLEAPPLAARTRVAHGRALLARGRPEDRDPAMTLLQSALRTAEPAGMVALAAEARNLLERG